MKIKTFDIEGLLLVEPSLFRDDRGLFYESYNEKKYQDILGADNRFVQDNISISKKNVLRGLHFQLPPFDQGKLVTVIQGSVLDVAVDLRKKSPTYGQYQSIELSAENKFQFWIPSGFAHGFISLQEETIFSYKCTNYYAPSHEQTILWNDLDLNINWNEGEFIISEKDKIGQKFCNFITPF